MDELVSENGTEGVLWTWTNKNAIKWETQITRYTDITKNVGENIGCDRHGGGGNTKFCVFMGSGWTPETN
jgi:hypothetical protein